MAITVNFLPTVSDLCTFLFGSWPAARPLIDNFNTFLINPRPEITRLDFLPLFHLHGGCFSHLKLLTVLDQPAAELLLLLLVHFEFLLSIDHDWMTLSYHHSLLIDIECLILKILELCQILPTTCSLLRLSGACNWFESRFVHLLHLFNSHHFI